jgi:DNA replication protein DnaC
MTNHSLPHYLKTLKLPTFLSEYPKAAKRCTQEDSSYETFLLDLSEKEVLNRQSRAVQQRIKKAHFPVMKTLESFDFESTPGLNKQLVLNLARCEYLEHHENIIALGNSDPVTLYPSLRQAE